MGQIAVFRPGPRMDRVRTGRAGGSKCGTKDRENLTSPSGQRDNSPKGDWIVFTSDRNGDEQFRIYLIRPDGTALHKLTDFIIRFDGTGLQQLTDDQREDGTPIWFSEPVVKLASSKASHP